MTVVGIGTLELVLILLLLILLFGPERIAEMGQSLGRVYRKLTGISAELEEQVAEVRKSVTSTLDLPAVGNPLGETLAEVNQLRQELSGKTTSPAARPAEDAGGTGHPARNAGGPGQPVGRVSGSVGPAGAAGHSAAPTGDAGGPQVTAADQTKTDEVLA
jgi:Sec-independent protein translocase protein TatA